MSQENVDIARQLNEAVRRRDMDAVLELLDPTFEWWDRTDDPGATVYRGGAGFARHIAELEEDVVELHVDAEEFIDAGDYVISPVRVHGRGRASGAPFEEHEVHVLKLRNGKVTQLREYHSKADALEAVGLPE